MHDFLYLNAAFPLATIGFVKKSRKGHNNTRFINGAKSPNLPSPVAKARAHFYAAGWSYRSAAKELGCSYQHLCEVLTGKRPSRRLISRVQSLPHR